MDKGSIYEHIKQQIIEEKLSPGHWFVENELCDTYRLSRTPIREILWKLKSDGLLEQEPNRGFVVRKLDLKEIFELYQAREAVEGMAARLACSKGGESFRSALRQMTEKLSEFDIEADPTRAAAHGRQLHDAIVEAARNGLLVDIYKKLNNINILARNITRKSSVIEKASREAHLILIDALLEQDEEKSERLMREHLRNACRQIVEQFYPNILGGGLVGAR